MDGGREYAEHVKSLGNQAFKKGDWEKAIELYREGVEAVDAMMILPADDVKCACYSNMAAALIKLEKYVKDITITMQASLMTSEFS
jgi:hypothetical protein